MKAEEMRFRLMTELQAQFSKTDATLNTPVNIETDTIKLDKPMMFMPKSTGRLELEKDNFSSPIKGIGFKNTTGTISTKLNENQEIYNMKELIGTNPENMRTISYDEKVVKAQLALVKKKEWQDVLFEDVDWFKKIDITSGIKKLFRIS